MKLTLIIIVCHIISLFANHLRVGNYPNRIIKTKLAHKPVHGLMRRIGTKMKREMIHQLPHNSLPNKSHKKYSVITHSKNKNKSKR